MDVTPCLYGEMCENVCVRESVRVPDVWNSYTSPCRPTTNFNACNQHLHYTPASAPKHVTISQVVELWTLSIVAPNSNVTSRTPTQFRPIRSNSHSLPLISIFRRRPHHQLQFTPRNEFFPPDPPAFPASSAFSRYTLDLPGHKRKWEDDHVSRFSFSSVSLFWFSLIMVRGQRT